MPKVTGDTGRGPFVRRSDVRPQPSSVQEKSAPAHDEFAKVMVKNGTGEQRHLFDVVKLGGSMVDPTMGEDHERAFWSRIAFTGEEVDEDGISNVAILTAPVQDGNYQTALVTGVSVVKLTGSTGKSRATTKNGAYTLEAADDGPFEILVDPGPTGEERYAYVRFNSGGGCKSKLVKTLSAQTAGGIVECAQYTGAYDAETVNGTLVTCYVRGVDVDADIWGWAAPLCSVDGQQEGGGTSSVSADGDHPSGKIGPADHEFTPLECNA